MNNSTEYHKYLHTIEISQEPQGVEPQGVVPGSPENPSEIMKHLGPVSLLFTEPAACLLHL